MTTMPEGILDALEDAQIGLRRAKRRRGAFCACAGFVMLLVAVLLGGALLVGGDTASGLQSVAFIVALFGGAGLVITGAEIGILRIVPDAEDKLRAAQREHRDALLKGEM